MQWHWFTMPDGSKELIDLDHCYRISGTPAGSTTPTVLYFQSGPIGVMETFQQMAAHLPARLTTELENPATLPPTPVVRRRM